MFKALQPGRIFFKRHTLLASAGVAVLTLLLIVTHPGEAGTSTGDLAQVENTSTSEPIILTDETSEYPLGLHLNILEDPTGELTIDEVFSPPYESQFTLSQVAVPNFGYTDSIYWVRLHLDNQTQHTGEWLLEDGFANTQFVDLYTPFPGGEGFDIRQTGVLRPISTRDVLYPNIVFNINLPPQSEQTYFLRFQSGASMTLPLTLWTKNAFIAASGQNLIVHWLLFGGLLSLLVYHLFLLFSLKEISYLYFVFLLVGIIAVLLEYLGYMSVYLLPGLYQYKTLYFPVFIAVMCASIILFSDSFLELKSRQPGLHWINIGLLVGWGVLVLLVPFINYINSARLMAPWQLFSVVVTWIIGILAWRKGARPVRFFMLAWLGMAASLVLVHLVRLAFIPSTFFNENIYQLGFVVMAVSWSMAMADRINLLKAETEGSNRELRNSEFRLSQILEGLPIGVVVYGVDQIAKYRNRRTGEILGDSSRKIPQKGINERTLQETMEYYSFQEAGTDEKYHLEQLPIYNALHGEHSSVDNLETNIGEQRIALEVWANPVRNEAGEVEAAVAAFQDITERKQAEAELVEYHKSLELQVEKRTAELSAVNDQLTHEIAERKKLEQTLVQRIGWLTQFNKIHQAITGTIDLAQADEQASQLILKLLDVQAVVITRWGTQEEDFVIRGFSQTGEKHSFPEGFMQFFQIDTPLRKEIEKGNFIQYSLDQFASLPELLSQWFLEQGVQSFNICPLVIRKAVVGVLGVASLDSEQVLASQTEDLLGRMAYDLANLAQDAELFDKKRALLTMEERNRLARELHDSVAQGLYSISLFVDAIRMALDSNRLDTVKQHLDELVDLSREAMADMRVLIFELRPPLIEKEGLVIALQTRLDSVEARAGFQTIFQSEGNIRLTKDKEGELYRIAQEALSNVIKHAHARKVLVRLSGDAGIVRLSIEDDGTGFDPDIVDQGGGQGLVNMYERAELIGARCTFESAPGQGTKVTVEVNP